MRLLFVLHIDIYNQQFMEGFLLNHPPFSDV
jgi:hypothetical protein